MRQKLSSELNGIVLDVMKKMKRRYNDKSQYKTILVGLKSTSKALAEITVEEIEDFKNGDE